MLRISSFTPLLEIMFSVILTKKKIKNLWCLLKLLVKLKSANIELGNFISTVKNVHIWDNGITWDDLKLFVFESW